MLASASTAYILARSTRHASRQSTRGLKSKPHRGPVPSVVYPQLMSDARLRPPAEGSPTGSAEPARKKGL